MKSLLIAVLLALSAPVFATNNNEEGPGPNQDHTCQGGHNCNTTGQGGGGEANAGAVAESNATAVAGASASADSSNVNLNVAEGGNAYASGGKAEQSQGQLQGQSQSSNNSNSSNNSSSQSTNLTFEGTGEASHYNKYGNNVSAYAPAIYSSSACTAGGLSAGVAGMGFGASIGGAKQDPQCQVRENARILAGLNVDMAIMYLCANPAIDVGAVLGDACKPPVIVVPPIVLPEPETAPVPIPVIEVDVKG